MSLLEDVFLQDEADEARELERVIEGDEYDERARSLSPNSDDHSEKENEAEEDKRRVDPIETKKRIVRNPRFILNPARLTGPRGIQVIPDHFKDFKFKGKGHEKEDLDLILKKLEHWAYRLYPKFAFEDCLKKIEILGKKRPVMVHLHKIRSDQFLSDEVVVQKDSDDEDIAEPALEEDEFDRLLQQQIELARATPAPGSVKKTGFNTPGFDNRSPMTLPKATSSPSISDEQRERILKNRRLAEERRLAKLKQNTIEITNTDVNNSLVNNTETINITDNTEVYAETDVIGSKVHNRSNIIDSSDEECDLITNQNTIVDVHNTMDRNINEDETTVNRNIISNKNLFDDHNNVDKSIIGEDSNKTQALVSEDAMNEINFERNGDKNVDECNKNIVDNPISDHITDGCQYDGHSDNISYNFDKNYKNINKGNDKKVHNAIIEDTTDEVQLDNLSNNISVNVDKYNSNKTNTPVSEDIITDEIVHNDDNTSSKMNVRAQHGNDMSLNPRDDNINNIKDKNQDKNTDKIVEQEEDSIRSKDKDREALEGNISETKVNKTVQNDNVSKDEGDLMESIEELMDVDFSDDF